MQGVLHVYHTHCINMEEQNNTVRPDINIGQLIKDELERQERSVSWFARKLYCDRSNIYKIFKRTTIDTELLMRISVVLNRDFFSEYINALAQAKEAGRAK